MNTIPAMGAVLSVGRWAQWALGDKPSIALTLG
jgi:hypothetical protein